VLGHGFLDFRQARFWKNEHKAMIRAARLWEMLIG
jgi:hypothetical protein